MDTPETTGHYDTLNRLVRTTNNGETTEYRYDNAGNRFIKIFGRSWSLARSNVFNGQAAALMTGFTTTTNTSSFNVLQIPIRPHLLHPVSSHYTAPSSAAIMDRSK